MAKDAALYLVEQLVAKGVGAGLVDLAAEWGGRSSLFSYIPSDYSPWVLQYQKEYHSTPELTIDFYCLSLSYGGREVGVWPVFFQTQQGSSKIGLPAQFVASSPCGNFVHAPIFYTGVTNKAVKAVASACFLSLTSVCSRLGQAQVGGGESVYFSVGFSPWYECFLRAGAQPMLRHDLFLDLAVPEEVLRSTFRRRYRSLINYGLKNWDAEIHWRPSIELWDEFRSLHLAVAGRVTRSGESWGAQYSALMAGEAFYISLRDNERRLIGGALFHFTSFEGVYAAAAYDRSLFDKPLSHVVQYLAIAELRSKGVRWYKLGPRYYKSDYPSPTEKELSIADFKQGFSSHLIPRSDFVLDMAGVG